MTNAISAFRRPSSTVSMLKPKVLDMANTTPPLVDLLQKLGIGGIVGGLFTWAAAYRKSRLERRRELDGAAAKVESTSVTEFVGLGINLIKELRMQVNDLQTIAEQHDTAMLKLTKENAEIRGMYDSLSHNHEELATRYKQLETDYSSIMQINDHLRINNETLQKENNNLRETNYSFNNTIRQYMQEIESLTSQVSELRGRMPVE